MIRSLALMDDTNPDTYWRSSEFFLGDALYIVPVHHPGQAGRFLYMPSGHWYDLWTDQPAPNTGAESWVPTPINHIPVFVRGGSILPRWPVQQYVGELEHPPCTLELWWAPETEVESYLYEDAGDGMAYRVGDYLLHRFVYKAQARAFSLQRHETGCMGPRAADFTLALRALPQQAQPRLVCDGEECPGCFDGQRVYRAQLPAGFLRLEVSF